MDITAVVGFGVIAALLCVIVRQYKPEMALGVSTAAGLIIMGASAAALAPSVSAISQLMNSAGLDEGYAQILIKALAVCLITQLAADCCRDAGECAIASRIELAGKAAVIAVSLPVFTSLAALVTGLLESNPL